MNRPFLQGHNYYLCEEDMIIGFQVQDQNGNNWGERPSYEILTEATAIKELKLARSQCQHNNYNMVAILEGDIEEATFEQAPPKKINNENDFRSLQEDFDGEVCLSNPTDIASLKVIEAARRLVESSTSDFTIVIPNNVDSIWAGDGSGEWIPAMIFIPNRVIF